MWYLSVHNVLCSMAASPVSPTPSSSAEPLSHVLNQGCTLESTRKRSHVLVPGPTPNPLKTSWRSNPACSSIVAVFTKLPGGPPVSLRTIPVGGWFPVLASHWHWLEEVSLNSGTWAHSSDSDAVVLVAVFLKAPRVRNSGRGLCEVEIKTLG